MIALGFAERLDALIIVCTHAYLRSVDIAVRHGDFSKALFLGLFASRRELATEPVGVALDACPPVLL